MNAATRYRTPTICNDKFPIGDAPYWRAFAAQAARALAAGDVTLDVLLFTTFFRGWERAQGNECSGHAEQDEALEVRTVAYCDGMRIARWEVLQRRSGRFGAPLAELVEWERAVNELWRIYQVEGRVSHGSLQARQQLLV